MERVLVSACLLGYAVRYNAEHKRCDDGVLRRWVAEGRVVSVCPEVADGTFTRTRVPYAGVTTAQLQAAGVQVFSEAQLAEADAFVRDLERRVQRRP